MEHQTLEGITIPVARSFRDVMTLRRSDLTRYGKDKATWLSMWLNHFTKPVYGFLWHLRMAQVKCCFILKPLKLWSCWRLRKYMYNQGLQIPRGVKIGYGLYVGHGVSVIVSEKAILGNNINLSPFTTIGATAGGAAVIGDNVYIGPNVNIVGRVNIGRDSTIGAGAVVTRDVPINVTVAGVPARVINDSGHPEYVNRRYGNS